MSDCHYLFSAKGGLKATVCASAVFSTLDYADNVLEVLSDEPADAWVLRDAFFCAVGKYISGVGAVDQNVIDVWNCYIWDLWL